MIVFFWTARLNPDAVALMDNYMGAYNAGGQAMPILLSSHVFENKLSIYIHTLNEQVIKVGEDVHIPKSFHRFAGLIEKLFYEKRIESEGKKLLEMNDMSFSKLIEDISPKSVVGLSSIGKHGSYCDVARSLSENSCIVIGGFQKCHFSDSIVSEIDQLVSIDSESLESHVVTARILYEYEKTIFK